MAADSAMAFVVRRSAMRRCRFNISRSLEDNFGGMFDLCRSGFWIPTLVSVCF